MDILNSTLLGLNAALIGLCLATGLLVYMYGWELVKITIERICSGHDDDDDHHGGGTLQPVYIPVRSSGVSN